MIFSSFNNFCSYNYYHNFSIGQLSEGTMHYPDDILWFVNFDKSQHKLSSAGQKNSCQAQQYK